MSLLSLFFGNRNNKGILLLPHEFKTKIKDLIHGWGETMSDKLKPCHECGFDETVTNQRVYKKEILPYWHRIYCCWCGRKTKSYETLNEAIKAWNSE